MYKQPEEENQEIYILDSTKIVSGTYMYYRLSSNIKIALKRWMSQYQLMLAILSQASEPPSSIKVSTSFPLLHIFVIICTFLRKLIYIYSVFWILGSFLCQYVSTKIRMICTEHVCTKGHMMKIFNRIVEMLYTISKGADNNWEDITSGK